MAEVDGEDRAGAGADGGAVVARLDNWGTPQWLFDRLDQRFGPFDLDAAAEAWSAKCERYLSREVDALGPDPWPGKRVWLNPPYKRELLIRFLRKSIEHAAAGGLVCALLPVRTETCWWCDLVAVKAAEIHFIRGRVAFQPPPGRDLSPRGNRPVFASAVAVFYGPHVGDREPRIQVLRAPRNSAALVGGQRELSLEAAS